MTLCQKYYLFLISEFSWKDFVTRNEINQFLFVSHAVEVLAYVLHVVWWLWSTANLFKCSNGLWYKRQSPRLVNLQSFGLVASLVNTLPKRPSYATEQHNLCDYRHPLFSSSNTISCYPTYFPQIEMFLIQCYNSTVLLCYPHTCNETVIYLSTLENTLQNRWSWKCNFLRLSINVHKKQSFFVFQGLHCL